MNCVVRYMTSTILLVFLGIQAVSHSQYYPTSTSYQFSSTGTGFQTSNDPNSYFNRRDLHPSYRQHQHHYHPSNDASVASSVQYYGTQRQPFLTTEVEDFRLSNSENAYARGWERAAAYRRRFNGRPTTESVSAEFPSQHLSQFDRHGVGIASRDNGEIDILIRDPNPPYHNHNNRKPEVHFYTPRDGNYPFRTSIPDTGSIERPPDTLIVVIHRPSLPSPSSPNGVSRYSPLSCKVTDDYEEKFYRKDRRCYRLGSKGPCGHNMKFYQEVEKENRNYGDCGCTNEDRFRPYVFWEQHDACYPLYFRGPCGYNEWLILDGEKPRCAPRKCPQNYNDGTQFSEFWFLYEGKCYKTGYHYPRFCKLGDEDKKVWFVYGSKVPMCLKSKEHIDPRPLAVVSELPCRPGYKKLQNGECKRKVSYDDDY